MFSSAPLTPRRRWLALTLATVLLQFAYWPVVGSLVAGDADLAGLLWMGLAVTPFVFLVLAFASGHPRAPGATGKAMGLFLLLALPVALIDVVVGLVAGFGAGAVLTLRGEEGVHSRRARIVAVGVAAVYLLALLLLEALLPVLGRFALVSGAVLPLAAVGFADEVSELRTSDDHADLSR